MDSGGQPKSVFSENGNPRNLHNGRSADIAGWFAKLHEIFLKFQSALVVMAEISSPRRSSTPSAIPTKRPLGLEDEQHTPAVPSPLNPDSASSRARRPPAPREQREKKESLKKREAKGVDSGRGATPESQSHGRKSKKTADTTSILSPIRYKLPPPTLNDFEPPKAPVFTPVLSRGNTQFYESSEQ